MLKKIIALFIFLIFSTTLLAGQIKQIVFLGDSLSDNGNLFNILKILPKSPPYYQGRFTNGPTWAEHIAKYYGDNSATDAVNYAVGGATSVLHNPIHDIFIAPVTLTGEVYNYLARSLFTDKSEALYVIWIGANDYLYEKDPDMDKISSRVVDNIRWAVTTLINQGGNSFIIMNLPDLSKTPYSIEGNLSDRLHSITEMHNTKLVTTINLLKEENPASQIVYIDVYTIFNDILNHVEKYNQQYHTHISNLNESCWKGGMILKNKNLYIESLNAELKQAFIGDKISLAKNFDTNSMSKQITNTPSLFEAYVTSKLYSNGMTPCANADEYIFWDHIHPTEVVHQVLAEIVEETIDHSGIDI